MVVVLQICLVCSKRGGAAEGRARNLAVVDRFLLAASVVEQREASCLVASMEKKQCHNAMLNIVHRESGVGRRFPNSENMIKHKM